MAQQASKGATTAQLRDDIDHGRTGDKVDFGDPAAAPLGTDEEAAGTPPDAETIAEMRRLECSGVAGPRPATRTVHHMAALIGSVVVAAMVVLLVALS